MQNTQAYLTKQHNYYAFHVVFFLLSMNGRDFFKLNAGIKQALSLRSTLQADTNVPVTFVNLLFTLNTLSWLNVSKYSHSLQRVFLRTLIFVTGIISVFH